MACSSRNVQDVSSPLHFPDYLSVCTSCTLKTAKDKMFMDRISGIRPLNSTRLLSSSDELSVSTSKMGLACRCKQLPTEADFLRVALQLLRPVARPDPSTGKRESPCFPDVQGIQSDFLATWKCQCFLISACLATPDPWLAVLVTVQGDSQSAWDCSKQRKTKDWLLGRVLVQRVKQQQPFKLPLQ